MKLSNIAITVWVMLSVITTTSVMGQQNKDKDSSLTLVSYSIHLVQPAKPYKFRNEKNEVVEMKTAYLVYFDLQNKPAFYNTALDFYIGDYKIPEYGSTPKGIYFRIYDKTLISKLNNQPLRYSLGRNPGKPLNAVFKLPEASLKLEPEEKVMKKNNH